MRPYLSTGLEPQAWKMRPDAVRAFVFGADVFVSEVTIHCQFDLESQRLHNNSPQNQCGTNKQFEI
jgi:hypothetical protein